MNQINSRWSEGKGTSAPRNAPPLAPSSPSSPSAPLDSSSPVSPSRLKPWIGVSLGDPSGIGPEVVLKAMRSAPELMSTALVFTYKAVLERALSIMGLQNHFVLVPMRLLKTEAGLKASGGWSVVPEPSGVQVDRGADQGGLVNRSSTQDVSLEPGPVPIHMVDLGQLSGQAQETFLSKVLPMPDPSLENLPPLGQIHAPSGEIAARAIVAATRAALQGLTQAVVTAPIHKEALALAGWPYPGHTEMLQAECARFLNQSLDQVPVRMMLKNRELSVVLVSIHISLRQAIERVTFDNVLSTLQITHDALYKTLGRAPKIALSALNPHAGEGGLMGHEEEEILKPVVAKALALGLDVEGPFAPDTIYMRARLERLNAQSNGLEAVGLRAPVKAPFDVVVSMYHDQGLIPVKYLGLDQGVNVTLGLPLIRTSPDHGTAFDLAGTGLAEEASFLEAFKEAQVMCTHAR